MVQIGGKTSTNGGRNESQSSSLYMTEYIHLQTFNCQLEDHFSIFILKFRHELGQGAELWSKKT
ncbi:MAG: hypothetical protein QME21_13805, partial [Anaerolineales bacterium]|nr:hypothetical protein [Anaerolineales bacterium]